MDDLLADLDPQQRAAVEHGDGPLLVVAGAGTGKTTTLAHRVARLVADGADPGRLVLLTFTRRASAEMLRRADAILARARGEEARAKARVWGGTFHAVAARLLRMHAEAAGLDGAFTIIDRSDAEELMGVLRLELGLARTDRRFPSKSVCLDVYSRCVNARDPLPDVLASAFPWCRGHADDLAGLFDAYVDRKADQRVLDYDDLLLYWHGLLADAEAGAPVRERFDHVLVDEYQDTNRLQADILRLMRPDGRGLTVVGDDAQAIYSFRAATVRNILDFTTEYPEATVLPLERNYRSTPEVVEATNRVIELAAERHDKTLRAVRGAGEPPSLVGCRDEHEQTEYVVRTVLEHREAGMPLRNQAVLFRATHHSMELEMELGRRDIPFRKYGGLRFMETAHVKDLLAFLRLAENPRDVTAGVRVLALLPGVGPATAHRLMGLLAASDGDFGAWERFDPPAGVGERWGALVAMMGDLAGAGPGEVTEQVGRVRAFYAPLMERRYDAPVSRGRDLEEIEHLSGRFGDRTRLLAELTLDPPSWAGDLAGPPHLDDDWLVLSTMHSAKGLEWDAVYVIHAADGNIPSDMATGDAEEIEEERRLFYVACTRARDHLHVCHPLRYYKHPRSMRDEHGFSQLTRFLPESVQASFTRAQAGPDAPDAALSPERADAVARGVRDGIKAMWRS